MVGNSRADGHFLCLVFLLLIQRQANVPDRGICIVGAGIDQQQDKLLTADVSGNILWSYILLQNAGGKLDNCVSLHTAVVIVDAFK